MSSALRVVLTGSNRGLGLEFARRYLGAGHHVVATCRDPARATALHELAAEHGARAIVTACDVADPDACDRIGALVPWDRVDLVVLNAGVQGGADPSVGAIDFAAAEHAWRVNALAPLRIARALWARLPAGGKVVAISSRMGSIADDGSGGHYGYRMSKAALNMAVRNLGHEGAPRGVVVCALHPGWVRTDMGGADAPLSIDESVGAMVATIASRTLAHSGGFFDKDGEVLPW